MNLPLLQNGVSCFPLPKLGEAEIPVYATLLERLENSLTVSQKALLSLDIAAVERGTKEQSNLCRRIEALFAHPAASPQNDDDAGKMQTSPTISANWPVELSAAQARILHRGRVQAALLSRAQRALNVVAHFKSLPEATYAAPKWQAYPNCGASQLK
jgi:hypothetical protein